MQSNTNSFIAGALSYLLWGFLPVMFKNLVSFSNTDIIFYRVCLSSIFISLFFVLTRFKIHITIISLYKKSKMDFWSMIILNLIGAICLVSNWLIYTHVIQKINVHTAAVGYLILPIITAFLALIILKERLSKLQWLAIGLSGISCYLMSNFALNEVLYILIIALSYSFYLITQRRNIHTSRLINLCIQMIMGAGYMLLFIPHITPVQNLDFSFWFYLSAIAIFFTVTPLLLNMYALNRMNTGALSFLGYINPIISFLLGILIYDEKLGTTEIFAYTLLTISLIIFNWTFIQQLFTQKKLVNNS